MPDGVSRPAFFSGIFRPVLFVLQVLSVLFPGQPRRSHLKTYFFGVFSCAFSCAFASPLTG